MNGGGEGQLSCGGRLVVVKQLYSYIHIINLISCYALIEIK